MNRTSGTIVSKAPRDIGKKTCSDLQIWNQKEGFYSDFQRHEARPIYRDIVDPISRPPESDIVLGGLFAGYCQ